MVLPLLSMLPQEVTCARAFHSSHSRSSLVLPAPPLFRLPSGLYCFIGHLENQSRMGYTQAILSQMGWNF